ncbi:MAG: glutathione S-transferase [Pseudomonadota bacterium]
MNENAQFPNEGTPDKIAPVALNAQSRPVLYSFRRCPYAMRARLALKSAGIEVELREVALKAKPDHMIEISPKATVPVLQLPDGAVIEQSIDIMHWALGENDPRSLLPDDEAILSEVEALVEENDGPFKRDLDRYKYPNRYEGVDALHHREQGLAFLVKLNSHLEENRYLFSNEPGFADFAIFPFVRQFANVDRSWFDCLPLAALKSWLEGHLSSAEFAAIMDKHKPWAPDDPVTLFGGL